MTTRNLDVLQKKFADHTTPFIFNCWYIAAQSADLSTELMERWILGRNVLLYRMSDGTPLALQNRCPHRSAPLSMGRKDGDNVVCGYHGLTFAPTGECISIPSQKAIAKNCQLLSYPLVERGPFLWIWMGAASLADEAQIPDLPWVESPSLGHVEGYFSVKANYLHLHENVLDLSHVPFLHGTHNATTQFAELEPDVEVIGDKVYSRRSEYERDIPPHYAESIGIGQKIVNRHTEGHFESPAIHLAKTRIENTQALAGERVNYVFYIAHAFTPETQHSTHYFWSNGRDTSPHDPDIDEVVRKRSVKVYTEDVVILEATEIIREREAGDINEISVVADKAGLQMRRVLARLSDQDRV